MHRTFAKYGAVLVAAAFVVPAGTAFAQSDALLAAALLGGNVNLRTSEVLLGGFDSLDDVASALDEIDDRRAQAVADLRDLEQECSDAEDDLRQERRDADTRLEQRLARDELRRVQRTCNEEERDLRDLVRDLDRDERNIEREFGDVLTLRSAGVSTGGISSLDGVRDAFEDIADREAEARDELRSLRSECDDRERDIRDDIREADGDRRDGLRDDLRELRQECRDDEDRLQDEVRALDRQERRLRSSFGDIGALRSISVDTDRLNALNDERRDLQRDLIELRVECEREEAQLRADARTADDRDERRDIGDRLSELRRECREDERTLRDDIRDIDRERDRFGRTFFRGSGGLFGTSRLGGLGALGLLGSGSSFGLGGFTRSSSLDLDRDDVLLALALR